MCNIPCCLQNRLNSAETNCRPLSATVCLGHEIARLVWEHRTEQQALRHEIVRQADVDPTDT